MSPEIIKQKNIIRQMPCTSTCHPREGPIPGKPVKSFAKDKIHFLGCGSPDVEASWLGQEKKHPRILTKKRRSSEFKTYLLNPILTGHQILVGLIPMASAILLPQATMALFFS